MQTKKPPKNLNTRAVAVKVLRKILTEGHHFKPALCRQIAPTLSQADMAFVNHLCFGVLRFYPRLMAFEQYLLASPLKPKDHDIALLLLVGLYQIMYLDTPTYAALHSTVEAVKPLKRSWAKNLVNGVLRSASRQKTMLMALPSLAVKTAHPDWLCEAFQTAWPDNWESIIEANLTHPPLSVRVNAHQLSLSEFTQNCQTAGIAAEPIPYCTAGFMLSPPQDVTALPGFEAGAFSVQDGAAQLAASLLDLKPHQRILDACAAPGGKTAHILELLPPDSSVIALDKDPQRLQRLQENLTRCHVKAEIQCADAAQPDTWWDGQMFDCILLDVPCSATGVIRRHPDIKYHRQPSELPEIVAEQQALLTKIWPLLKPGGILLYATCSILPAENAEQMEWFVAQEADAIEWPIEAPWGLKQTIGRQILPGQHHMDGFYYARVRKAG